MIQFSECVMLPIDQMKPAPYNPRVDLSPDDPIVLSLKESMQDKRKGIVAASVWNKRTGNIVGGNIRYKAYRLAGFEAVPVNVVDLPLDEEMTLNIALNRISGEFDAVKYNAALQRIVTAGLDAVKAGATLQEMAALTGKFDFSSVPSLSEITYDPPVHAMYKCPCCGFTEERKRFKKVPAS